MSDLQLSGAAIANLREWARLHPTIARIYAFGSRARGTARPDSDLDLAMEFDQGIDSADAELIENNAKWRAELAALLSVRIDKIYGADSDVARPGRKLVYARANIPTSGAARDYPSMRLHDEPEWPERGRR